MSILKNNLTGLSWTHNLEHIFKYIDIYYRMIENFKKFIPILFMKYNMKNLLMILKTESKKLLNSAI